MTHNNYCVVLCYKSYSNLPGISHIGLGVTAINTAKYLRSHGIKALVLPVVNTADVETFLKAHPEITHLNMSALWVPTETFGKWCALYPHVHFSVTSHSNVAFLQVEHRAILLIRDAINLEETTTNFKLCGNSDRFISYIKAAYGAMATELPNLYFLNEIQSAPRYTPWRGGTLRIGIFGAMRLLKNFNTAAAAALQISRELKAQTEIWINGGRKDFTEATNLANSIKNTVKGVPLVTLKEYNWAPWPEFRKTVGSMHLLLQPSHSESFNNVTADGISESVPSVVSNAIDWAPPQWQANCDDVNDVARVGMALLHDPKATVEGYQALQKHNQMAFALWLKYLATK
jgi:hypothetical protein